ncbi:MAG TPA: hypothetical protein VHA30_02595, partial [Patescibacteria group bacterium]|nr:hypothetical protein [Patescibacteria group bacterium]
SYNVGDTAVFTAAGGSGSYSWSGSGSPASGSGSAFNTVFSSSGSKTVTVSSSDGQVASCSTTINQPNSQQGSLLLTKTVKNLTAGDSAFSHSTSGKQGDTLQYQIQVSAGSAITLSSVVVTDTFASGLSYISNSLLVNGQPHASGLSSGGLTFASLSQSAPLTITYQATIAATNGTLVNTAQASASNSSNSPSDQASVAVTYVNPGQPALSITKQVENLTQGGGYSSSISANKGDVVQYQVVVRNVGQATANNVFVNDSNPVGVQPLYNISASVQMTGGIPQGIALGNLSAGASVTVTYQGTVNVQSGTVINTATVSADNAASQNASAQVYVNAPNTGNTGGDCNNSSNSCNTNTNNNNQNGSGTNSSNQNNQNNINGDNNTVTNTNNNCVNNSCNVYYINNAGSTVPANQFSQLSITKNVRLYGSGTFQNSVSAQNGQSVQFEIVVTNTGSAIANNVRVTDMLPSGLSLSGGSVTVNGSWVSDSNIYGGMYVGNLYGGQSARIDFTATVNAAGNSTVQNTATASSDNAGSVQASAWVFLSSGSILGGNVNLSYQKSAFNNSKNSDATVVNAAPGDSITYTLTVTNNGNAPANSFIITDDLSQVLPYADVVDNGGGSLSGNTISFPGLTVPAGGSVTRSFKVQVKTSLSGSLSYVMSNSYGNNVSVRINNPQVAGAFTAPTTGADTDALTFSALLTAAAGAFRHRKSLLKLLFS